MSLHAIILDGLLGIAVLACWTGVVGMLRMRHATQALHYLSFPASLGIGAVTAAVFLENGFGAAGLKTLLIGLVLLAINSVVTHASARAIRTRQLGHWEPLAGDAVEWLTPPPPPEQQP